MKANRKKMEKQEFNKCGEKALSCDSGPFPFLHRTGRWLLVSGASKQVIHAK